MTPAGPLSDDWLYWDPQTIDAYPHWTEPRVEDHAPEQLDLFGEGEDPHRAICR